MSRSLIKHCLALLMSTSIYFCWLDFMLNDNQIHNKVSKVIYFWSAFNFSVSFGRLLFSHYQPTVWITFLYRPQLCRFEATRRIRSVESKVNEKIASGEATIEMYGNVSYWHTPILAMTADVIQASNEECMKCGMDDYVSKPFEEGQLYSTVVRFFDQPVRIPEDSSYRSRDN